MKYGKTGFIVLAFVLFVAHATAAVSISFSHLRTLKDNSFIYEDVRNVVTGPDGYIYILDGRKCSVYRFDAEGRYLGSFGKQGEGPGEFRQVWSLVMDEGSRLFVAENRRFVSMFDRLGTFIKRIDLEGETGIRAASWQLAGPDLYLCVRHGGDDDRQQLADAHGQVLPLDLFTLPNDSIPVNVNGTRMSYRIRIPDSTPNLIFCHAQKYNAMAFSKEYLIKLVDEKGNLLATIKQDVQLQHLNEKEKADMVDMVNCLRIPPQVKDAAIKQMPVTKNIIDNILMSDRFLWVVRVKKDLTDRSSPFPVDLYDLNGRYLGDLTLPQYPVWIDSRHFFSLNRNDEDDLLIEQYSYKLGVQ